MSGRLRVDLPPPLTWRGLALTPSRTLSGEGWVYAPDPDVYRLPAGLVVEARSVYEGRWQARVGNELGPLGDTPESALEAALGDLGRKVQRMREHVVLLGSVVESLQQGE